MGDRGLKRAVRGLYGWSRSRSYSDRSVKCYPKDGELCHNAPIVNDTIPAVFTAKDLSRIGIRLFDLNLPEPPPCMTNPKGVKPTFAVLSKEERLEEWRQIKELKQLEERRRLQLAECLVQISQELRSHRPQLERVLDEMLMLDLQFSKMNYRYSIKYPHLLPRTKFGYKPKDFKKRENSRKYLALMIATEYFYAGKWKESDMEPIYGGAIPWVVDDEHAIAAANYAISFLNNGYRYDPDEWNFREVDLICGGICSSTLDENSILKKNEEHEERIIKVKQLIRVNVRHYGCTMYLLTLEASDDKFYEAKVSETIESTKSLIYIRPAKYYPEIPDCLCHLIGPDDTEEEQITTTQFDNNNDL